MNTGTPFEVWAAHQGVQMTPAHLFDYRGTLGPEHCDQVAAGLLAIAHEMATLLHTGKVVDSDLDYAHQEIFNSLKWALRFLAIPPDGSPEYRASIREQYLETDPGPQDCGMDCYICSGDPANDPQVSKGLSA